MLHEGESMSEEILTGQIGRISIAVELGGKTHFVNLPQDRLRMLVANAAMLSDNGVLSLIEAPDGFRFTTLEEA
jgi:hypothetical protein